MAASPIRARTIRANDLDFGILEAGPAAGPLALCLHGFPDSAQTWRHLLPELAGAGFHAVAPFMRGYTPTGIPADGEYGIGALAADAIALHDALGGDGDAVLIGHDWGAEAAYPAAAHAPDRWRSLVTLAVPPASLDDVLFADYDQLKRFFYLFMFRDPAGFAADVVAAGMAFLDRLWRDWSPGTTRRPTCQRQGVPARPGASRRRSLTTAPLEPRPAGPYAALEQAALQRRRSPRCTCTAPTTVHRRRPGSPRRAVARPGSRVVVIEGAGHFLHLEQPGSRAYSRLDR